jgi:enediyne biosynthesis protein E4
MCVLMVLAGCDPAPPEKQLPPLVCKTPSARPQPWFTEVTNEIGLAPTATFVPLGTAVVAGDLDGDGFADLISSTVSSARETAANRQRFLLLNRPDPADASRRVLVDFTAESGLLATRDGVGGRGFGTANLGDLDNDGDLDVITCPASVDANTLDPCTALLNDGKAHFTLAPPSALQAASDQTASAALLDYDRDGVLDFWPATFGSQPYLFRGLGDGTFVEIGASAGLPQMNGARAQHLSYRQTFGVTACDLDGDGDDDVLLADYGREANQVWQNNGNGTFTEIAQSLGVAFDDRMDYTDDLSYQCYCKNAPGSCPATVPVPNDCSFTRGWTPGQSDQPWRLGGNNFSLTCGDLDDDGDMDLMSATIRHGDVGSAADPSEIIRNDTPPGAPLMKFTRPGNKAMGIERINVGIGWNEGDMMPVFADVDLDGRKDIYLTSSDYPLNHGWLWHQKADHTFEDITDVSGGGAKQIHGVALVDLDNDGDLDLVAGTSTARGGAKTQALRVYRNDPGEQNWLRLRLLGNASAIGARVRVTAGGRTQTQQVQGGYGHETIQNDLVLTFGLGGACMVDSVEVRWPDGTVSTFTELRANYRIELRQGEADPVYPQ